MPARPQQPETPASLLRRAGLRATPQRTAVLAALDSADHPVTADALRSTLPAPAPDLATIYRTLAAFASTGLARRLPDANGSARYERARPASEPHDHHVTCRACGRVDTVGHCLLGPLEDAIRARGYRHVSHLVEFTALCADCARPHALSPAGASGPRRRAGG